MRATVYALIALSIIFTVGIPTTGTKYELHTGNIQNEEGQYQINQTSIVGTYGGSTIKIPFQSQMIFILINKTSLRGGG